MVGLWLAGAAGATGCGSGDATAAADDRPGPGGPGVGDRLHPRLGNGGYVVEALDVDLRFGPGLRRYSVTTGLRVRATQDLSRLNLDFARGTVRSVTVDGRRARHRASREDLVVTPARTVRAGRTVVVRTRAAGTPVDEGPPSGPVRLGLLRAKDSVFTRFLPGGAHLAFPLADHPRHKAPATLRVTTPPGVASVANGRLRSVRRTGTGTTRTFVVREPVSPALLQVAAGPFRMVSGTGAESERLRLVVPRGTPPRATRGLRVDLQGAMAFLRRSLGPEPISVYGAVVPPRTGPAIETQGLTLLNASFLPRSGRLDPQQRATLVHELAHEWFGNAVSVRSWDDLWIAEGHAEYWEHRWRAAHGGPSMAEVMDALRRSAAGVLRREGPLARPRASAFPRRERAPYGAAAYVVGPLVIEALEREVGPDRFAAIERAWVTERRGSVGGTAELAATASRIAGRDLAPFFHRWTAGTAVPVR